MSGVIIDFCIQLQQLVWSMPFTLILLGVGVYFTFKSGFFQIKNIKHILKTTIFSVFAKKEKQGKEKGFSPFQVLATTLGATLGTGNIAGVATAITIGGPGAIFWMWVSAIFGAMTAFAENSLGLFYREKRADGFRGGAMYILKKGMKNKKVAVILGNAFAFFCLLASFGIGNTVQTNTIVSAMNTKSNSILPQVIGISVSVLMLIVIFGGAVRITRVSQWILPLVSGVYIVGTLIIIFINIRKMPLVLSSIMKGAFGLNSVVGGGAGFALKNALSVGFRRGVFSNEAGMGSLVIVNSESSEERPAVSGMWGVFEVVFDTLIICSLTAFAILSSGAVDILNGASLSGNQGAALVREAFSKSLGNFSGIFIAFSTVFFAFSTLLGWSFYGIRCADYLFGSKGVTVYKIIFSVAAYFGAVTDLRFIWILSDIFNGLMALPNLIAVIIMSPTVIKILKDYKRGNNL